MKDQSLITFRAADADWSFYLTELPSPLLEQEAFRKLSFQQKLEVVEMLGKLEDEARLAIQTDQS